MSGVSGVGDNAACPRVGAAVAYAWHAAEPEEEQLLREHLPGCASCRAAVRDAHAVADELARAVPDVDPPAALRERILSAVAAEPAPPRPSPSPDGVGRTPRPTPGGTDAPTGPRPPARGPTPDRPRRGIGALVLLTAAVVLGVVLLAGRALLPGVSGAPQAAPVPPDPASLAARAAQVVDDAQAADPGVRHAVLRDGSDRAVAVVLDDGGTAGSPPRLVPLALDAPPAGRSWVLWGAATGTAAPVALGAVDPSTGRSPDAAARAPDPGGRYAVSDEPAGTLPPRPSTVLAIGTVV